MMRSHLSMQLVLHEAFGTQLESEGFVQSARRRWVRSVKAPIREVVQVNEATYWRYKPYWGLSLDWAPHVSGTSVKWHRTAKSARLDLWHDPERDPKESSFSWLIRSNVRLSVAFADAQRVAMQCGA